MRTLTIISVFVLLSVLGCNSNVDTMIGTWVGNCNGHQDTLVITRTVYSDSCAISLNGAKRNGKISGGKLLVPIVDVFLEISYDPADKKLHLKEVTLECTMDKIK